MQSREAEHAVPKRLCMPTTERQDMQCRKAVHTVYRRQGMQSLGSLACSL